MAQLFLINWNDRILAVGNAGVTLVGDPPVRTESSPYERQDFADRLGVPLVEIEEQRIPDTDWSVDRPARTKRDARWNGAAVEDGAPTTETAPEADSRKTQALQNTDNLQAQLNTLMESLDTLWDDLAITTPKPRAFGDLLARKRSAFP